MTEILSRESAHEATFYEATGNGHLHCLLCPHDCIIKDGQAGFCGVRKNWGGVLWAESYGYISSYGLDPIEKKPLYRFHPGSLIFSIGNFGCNFRCPFCQNHGISMNKPSTATDRLTPMQTAILAERLIPDGNIGIAYTYNEPLIGYEFVYDCAVLAQEKGLMNVLVTNGYIREEPLKKLLPFIDALNIDLKAYNETFYGHVSGDLESVKQTIKLAAAHAHVELTTLVIPDENDSDEEIAKLALFIAEINPEIPLHLSRFFPQYKMTAKPPTPKETVVRLKAVAKQYLHYVYLGNMR